jgi:hypothetical protein
MKIRLTCSDQLFFACAGVSIPHQYGVFWTFLQVDDFVAKGDVDTIFLYLSGGPREVVGVLFASGDCRTTVDEGEKAVFTVEIRQESIWGARVSQGGEIFHKARKRSVPTPSDDETRRT